MTDTVGVLGEATGTAVGLQNVYTVPSGKAARCRIMYRGVSGTNSTLQWDVNGITVALSTANTVNHVQYSSAALLHNNQTAASVVDGTTEARTVMPYERDYWLSAGDRIDVTIGTAAYSSFKAMVVGTEVDVE